MENAKITAITTNREDRLLYLQLETTSGITVQPKEGAYLENQAGSVDATISKEQAELLFRALQRYFWVMGTKFAKFDTDAHKPKPSGEGVRS